MYCSTCGARVPEGRSRCDTCGSPVSRPSGYGIPAAATQARGPLAIVATCPRCGYQGQGSTYFSQGGPVAVLVLVSLFTWALGGLVYYLLRRDFRVCPRCGESWGPRGERALALGPGSAGAAVYPAVAAAEGEEVESSRGWMFGAYVMFAFAFILMMAGLGEGEFAPFLLGALSAGGGVAMVKGANRAREQRRQALLVGLQQPVLRLAEERGGRLTVTEVASSLGWPMPRAEKVLNSMEDGLRIASEVTDDGVIVYEFRELMHAPRLNAAEMDTLLGDGGASGGGTMRA
ncbi:MAG TPA: hypothetical protein VFR37_13105 [Longimicrobium sp.]|nr:hypothetical protein [Longimicrobium sp.]